VLVQVRVHGDNTVGVEITRKRSSDGLFVPRESSATDNHNGVDNHNDVDNHNHVDMVMVIEETGVVVDANGNANRITVVDVGDHCRGEEYEFEFEFERECECDEPRGIPPGDEATTASTSASASTPPGEHMGVDCYANLMVFVNNEQKRLEYTPGEFFRITNECEA